MVNAAGGRVVERYALVPIENRAHRGELVVGQQDAHFGGAELLGQHVAKHADGGVGTCVVQRPQQRNVGDRPAYLNLVQLRAQWRASAAGSHVA